MTSSSGKTAAGRTARSRVRWTIGSVLIAAVLLTFLLRQLGGGEFREALRQLTWQTMLLGLGIYALSSIVRSLRFAILLPAHRVYFLHLWAIQAASQMASVLLPFRSGEIAYPLYLKRAGVPMTVGVAGVLVSRLQDVMSLLSLGTLSLLFALGDNGHVQRSTLLAAIVATLAGTVALILLSKLLLTWAIERFPVRLARFRALLSQEVVPLLSARRLAATMALSYLLWTIIGVFYLAVIASLRLEVFGFWGVLFGASAATLANVQPLSGFAGLGTIEAGWVGAALLLGVPAATALGVGLTTHIVHLASVGVLGIIAQFLVALDSSSQTVHKGQSA